MKKYLIVVSLLFLSNSPKDRTIIQLKNAEQWYFLIFSKEEKYKSDSIKLFSKNYIFLAQDFYKNKTLLFTNKADKKINDQIGLKGIRTLNGLTVYQLYFFRSAKRKENVEKLIGEKVRLQLQADEYINKIFKKS